jgi:excisionase family DNA binding protein
MAQDTFTPKEAARQLGISNATIYRWLKNNWINGIRLPNGYIRIPRVEVEKILKSGVEEFQNDFAESAKW